MVFRVKETKPPASKAGIVTGDVVTHINGERIWDNFDLIYFETAPNPVLRVNRGGESVDIVVKKSANMPLGIEFEGDGFGKLRCCANNCVFCFVDQLPAGMRESLYFKDDDWRMSFVMGNYVTLTNVSDGEFERIIKRRVAPLYISVHAADESVAVKMMGRGKNVMARLARLKSEGLQFHAQVVMVPFYNDGDVLEDTISRLIELSPAAKSLAIVPVGLTKHRQGLAGIKPVDEMCAGRTIGIINKYQEIAHKKTGTRFVFASDEMYIRANLPLPAYEEYEDFPQLENGVGMIANFTREVEDALEGAEISAHKNISCACGVDFAPYLRRIADAVGDKTGVNIEVFPVQNDFFGESVTVSGLITGGDIIAELKGKPMGEVLLLPTDMFRAGTRVFLDDMHLDDVEQALNVKIIPVDNDGYDFVDAVCGRM